MTQPRSCAVSFEAFAGAPAAPFEASMGVPAAPMDAGQWEPASRAGGSHEDSCVILRAGWKDGAPGVRTRQERPLALLFYAVLRAARRYGASTHEFK